ncbi:WD40 repeat-like protein [Sistotremastrum niveocremeum HHB9708]|uniref:WD40 repeat-like protein n=1 Tax=Sistotremastrum niveocremeum HHB9708 TaxID=1314777 RepID=A0A164SP63_9AGAM|nr:WD40 repeat-like protein [Sistotremastrum niveocremeum HHB9708]
MASTATIPEPMQGTEEPIESGNTVAEPSLKTRKKARKGKDREELLQPPTTSATVEEADEYEDDVPQWSWKSLTDAAASKHPATFTKDGRYFFLPVSSTVKVYSTATGKVVSTLSGSSSSSSSSTSTSHPHTHIITSAIINPHNAFQLITASLDGFIKVWDYSEGVLLRTLKIGKPITRLCAHQAIKDFVFVAVNDQKRTKYSERVSSVLRVSLKPTSKTKQSQIQTPADVVKVGKTRAVTGLALSSSGAWLVAIGGPRVYVCSVSSLDKGFVKFYSPKNLTCLAMNPVEESFSTGDEEGQIRVWHCFDDLDRRPITLENKDVERRTHTTAMHWHAHAVASLAYAPNGAYLLSAGEEGVLVAWQLHSGKKEFVPRVGAPINTVAILEGTPEQGMEYVLGLADGTLVFVTAANLKVSRFISRVKIDSQTDFRHHLVPLAVHLQSSTILLPSSHPSSLQIYSPGTDTLLSELEVSPSNRVSRRDEKPIDVARVEFASISDSGDWLATVDLRTGDDEFVSEVYLKLWRWKDGEWSLNTRIDHPHGTKKVTAIEFRPSVKDAADALLVTAGEDGFVKTWKVAAAALSRRKKREGSEEAELYWVNRSSHEYRSQIPSLISWAPDGSLFAVAHSSSPMITILNPSDHALRETVGCPEIRTGATHMSFVGRTGRFLAISGKKDVVLWDLLSGSVHWHYSSPSYISHLVVHPVHNSIAVLQARPRTVPTSQIRKPPSTQVSVFSTASPIPTRVYRVPFYIRSVIWDTIAPVAVAQASPSSPDHSERAAHYSLIGITDKWSVNLFGDEVQVAPARTEGEAASQLASANNVAQTGRRTLFQDIFGKSAFVDVSQPPALPAGPTDATVPSNKIRGVLGDIFNVPAYLCPPMETIFGVAMEEFLRKPPEEEDVHEDQEPGDGDVEMQGVDEADADAGMKPPDQARRTVEQWELDTMTALFSKTVVQAPERHTNGKAHHPEAAHPVNGTNGTINGKSKSATNGKISPSKPSPIPTVIKAVPSVPNSPSNIASPRTGSKRKQSST